jgi:hypothetical protein
MAFPSSSAPFAAFSPLGFLPVTEKLTRKNFAMWERQILSTLKGAQMAHFIALAPKMPEQFLPPKDGKKDDPPVETPDWEEWIAKDQQVLSYLLNSISTEIAA